MGVRESWVIKIVFHYISTHSMFGKGLQIEKHD